MFRCAAMTVASFGSFGVGLASYNKHTSKNNSFAKESNKVEGSQGHGHAVVIGGGVIGLSSALRLVEAGCEVTVVEATNSVASATSRINGAILCPSMVTCWANAGLMYERKYVRKSLVVSWDWWTEPLFYRWAAWFWFNTLFPGRLKNNNEALLELAHYSMQCLQQEEQKYPLSLNQNKTAKGTLKLFQDHNKMDKFLSSQLVRFWRDKGKEYKALSVEECLKLEPALAGVDVCTNFVGGVVCCNDSSGDIAVYCNNVYTELERRGVHFSKGDKVLSLEVKQGQVTGARLQSGRVVRGDKFVICAGLGSTSLAASVGVNLPILPIKGHIATVRARQGEPALLHTIDSHKHGLIAPLAPDTLRMSSGMEIVGYQYSIDEDAGRGMVSRAAEVLKEGYICSDSAEYDCGLRPVSADDVPIIGQTHISNLWVNTGHGSKGWTLSWGSASLLASLMCGKQPSIDPTRYSPTRFHPCRTLLTSKK